MIEAPNRICVVYVDAQRETHPARTLSKRTPEIRRTIGWQFSQWGNTRSICLRRPHSAVLAVLCQQRHPCSTILTAPSLQYCADNAILTAQFSEHCSLQCCSHSNILADSTCEDGTARMVL